ncbi:MAG: FMN-binding protein [Clostridia bacterium]|nr:FMN-binding protein [Clostridia bacterium]
MKSRSRQLLNLVLVSAVSVALLAGMDTVGGIRERGREAALRLEDFRSLIRADSYEELSVDDDFTGNGGTVLGIHRALSPKKDVLGYIVLVKVPGHSSDLTVRVAVGTDAATVSGVRIVSHGEDAAKGGQVALPFFYTQFDGILSPLYLKGEQPAVEPQPRILRDGTFTATDAEVDPATGYRYTLTLTVENGRIADAVWDGLRDDGGKQLRQASRDGEVAAAEGDLPWHEQAIAIEGLLIGLGDPSFIVLEPDGTARDAADVTIPVSGFVRLAEDCVVRASTASRLAGEMNDGIYRSESASADPDTGYRDVVEITVENGAIVSVSWDGLGEDGSLRSQAEDGGGVPEGSVPWSEQSAQVAERLKELQDPTVVLLDGDGRSAEFPGITIPVRACLDRMLDAMLQAGMSPAPAPTPTPPVESGQIDAVSGATITSRAVVKAGNLGVEYVAWLLDKSGDAGS